MSRNAINVVFRAWKRKERARGVSPIWLATVVSHFSRLLKSRSDEKAEFEQFPQVGEVSDRRRAANNKNCKPLFGGGPVRLLSIGRLTRLCAFGLALSSVSIHAQHYVEVSVDLETYSYKLDDLREGKHPIRQSNSVSCTAGTNEWRIDIAGTNWTKHWAYDGTNLYCKMATFGQSGRRSAIDGHLATSPSKEIKSGSVETNSTLHIFKSRDGCPLDMQVLNITWLSFCSGTYLKREGRIIPYPVVDLRHAPDGFAYSDQTKTFDDEVGLPQSINLYASESLFETSVMSDVFEGKHDVGLWKRGSMGFKWDLPEGTLRFRYSVTEFTNCMGWNIPLRFEWFLHVPENGNFLPLGYGKATSIRPRGKPESVFTQHPGGTTVDWRLGEAGKGVKGIIYQYRQ